MKRQEKELIAIAQEFCNVYVNKGVSIAIAHAFNNPDGIVDIESNEYKEISNAYWQTPSDMIPDDLLDDAHELCSGSRCKKCRDRALQLLLCDESIQDHNQAQVALNILIKNAYDNSDNIGCSHDFCVIDSCSISS
ncbi:MAG: hypothetical protein KAT04_09270 [Methylococcales bacterium]|nr:hypothetical protein [Methylococcales bacterium]